MNSASEIILSGLCSIVIAQLLKVILYYKKFKTINYSLLSSTGGIPSSHSTVVMSAIVSLALTEGVASPVFAIAVIFGFIVMYDAAGPRRATGQIATQLNDLIDRLYKKRPLAFRNKLKELLGHTPYEVFMGALLGTFIALVIHFIAR